MADQHNGACFCGAVEIEVTGAPNDMGHGRYPPRRFRPAETRKGAEQRPEWNVWRYC